MFAIFGAIIGWLQAISPKALDFMQDKRDKAHELDVMQLQMQMQEKGINQHLEEVRITAQQVEAAAIQKSYQAELKYTGKYSASVRPTITYLAMALYIVQKLLLVGAIILAPTLPWLGENATLSAVAAVVVTEFDCTLLGWIIGFWFGSRDMKK